MSYIYRPGQMGHSPFCEAIGSIVAQEIACILWSLQV